MAENKKKAQKDERQALLDRTRPKGDALDKAKSQLRTAAKAVAIAVVVVWLLAAGFASGLTTPIPLYIAGAFTVSVAAVAFLVNRNLKRSERFGALISGDESLSAEEKEKQLVELRARVDKGDAGAILAQAQMLMQDDPVAALTALEKVDLEKANKLIALQVAGTRAMIHLNQGDVKPARELADKIDLSKAPDLKVRGTMSAVVAEAWARTGNPIEASELLDKYNPDDKEFDDTRLQLLRARAFAAAHRQDLPAMRRAVKQLTEISPQLMGMFVGQKRIHPLLEQEAKKALEKSGFVPRQRVQMVRR